MKMIREISSIQNTKKIFPDFEFSFGGHGRIPEEYFVEMSTNVRIIGEDGRLYLTIIYNKYDLNNNSKKRVISSGKAMERFIFNCYQVIVLGKVDLDTVLADGTCPYKLDEDQSSEKQRMIEKSML